MSEIPLGEVGLEYFLMRFSIKYINVGEDEVYDEALTGHIVHIKKHDAFY